MKRYEFWRIVALVAWIWVPGGAQAQAPGTLCSTGALGPVACIRPAHAAFDICQHIQDTSRRHLLDPGFFARLLWQESRFDANALSPAGAQGIAQFMPGTAKLRGLQDSYNPAEAMERSAHYLADLQRRFGNPGMAAVAYNGGERRASGFLEGGGLARETINYVRIITGLNAEDWRDAPPKAHDFRLDGATPFMPACLAMAKARRVTSLGPPPPRYKPWGVQLGFGKTAKAARANVARQTRECRGLVAKETVDYINVPSRIRGRAPYIMGRIGRQTRDGAGQLCRTLARAGCICRIYRNPG
ncbi:lytic transglycosylase domain-containing protein [uncultured Tateyamaria sp.]|uniref:lytic transglycosylase domain-containing protein n=1 Tax=uncultured Tateyamaria sp. TaxID=455651 RepID=UPI00262C97A7|nr:transglycosylase SLT domain-containing protein [uncultured Tateyamaria sp.]